ncbi:MAG: SLOG family protein [Oscillospiraceae bacterium]
MFLFENPYTCCFTGHRIIDPAHRSRLSALLSQQLRRLIAQGCYIFVAGGALGFDMLAAETVLALRSEFPLIRLIVVAPCADQTALWNESNVLRYERVRRAANDYICLSASYTPGCMAQRNHVLVDMSGVCVAYCLRTKSGSAQTIAYAQRQSLTIINLSDNL